MDGQKNYVMFSFLGTSVLIGIYWLKQGKLPKWDVLIGGGIAFTFLSMTSEASPDLANAGAIGVFVTSLLIFGPSVFGFLNGVTAGGLTSQQTAALSTPGSVVMIPSGNTPGPAYIVPSGAEKTTLPSGSYYIKS
jgi:hypothetical protein